MTGYLLFSEILFRRLYHFGDGEERLRGDNGDNRAQKEKRKRVCAYACSRKVGCEALDNADNSDNDAHYNEDVTEYFKDLCRTVKPFEEVFNFFHKTKLVEFWRKVTAFCGEVIGIR